MENRSDPMVRDNPALRSGAGADFARRSHAGKTISRRYRFLSGACWMQEPNIENKSGHGRERGQNIRKLRAEISGD